MSRLQRSNQKKFMEVVKELENNFGKSFELFILAIAN